MASSTQQQLEEHHDNTQPQHQPDPLVHWSASLTTAGEEERFFRGLRLCAQPQPEPCVFSRCRLDLQTGQIMWQLWHVKVSVLVGCE
jgi:hypothetical protein